ncbi:MAG: hypothetical protein IJ681_02410 [Bacteroidales bacterium]|nr:hypothetical protein [Bacteroidales bacterium]
MKVNWLYSIIAVCITALLAYGLYSISKSTDNSIIALGSFFFMGIPLVMAMGVKSRGSRITTNLKVLSAIFFFIALVINVVFAFLNGFSVPLYIILNGILTLVFVFIYHNIYKV